MLKQQNLIQKRAINLMTIIAISAISLAIVNAEGKVNSISLDGKSFKGKIYWDKPIIRWLRFSDTIEFKDGMISSTLSLKGGYKITPYNTKKINGKIIFSARAMRDENDFFDWSGVFDGESLEDVKMEWTKDGEIRHYKFKQK
ncbi:MAG: hypothetical protein DWQ06_04020 [Calditrichaeota bacterium]|nr:MAG: hypothetical protein DWQ06_04020 [Calditrichota bacterium]